MASVTKIPLPAPEDLDNVPTAQVPALIAAFAAAQGHLAARLIATPPYQPTDNGCFLTVVEVASRLCYEPKTIRNLVSGGAFERGKHYVKRRGRLMFDWAEVEQWARGRSSSPAAASEGQPRG